MHAPVLLLQNLNFKLAAHILRTGTLIGCQDRVRGQDRQGVDHDHCYLVVYFELDKFKLHYDHADGIANDDYCAAHNIVNGIVRASLAILTAASSTFRPQLG